MIHGHGNDIHKFGDEISLDVSTNVWFRGMPSGLELHLKNNIHLLESYPEPDSGTLCRSMEQFFGLQTKTCFIDAGTTAIFYTLARIFQEQRSEIIIPAFAEYEDAARAEQHQLKFTMNHLVQEHHQFDSDIVWFGHPNNPDGKAFEIPVIESWLQSNPETMFMIDESYIDLCCKVESTMSLLAEYRNLVLVKSFTKSFCIPGLRLGAVFAHSEIIQKFRKYQIPWAVNALADAAGSFILQNYQEILPSKNEIEDLRTDLIQRLNHLPMSLCGLSSANYLLYELRKGNSESCKEYLRTNFGILIRDASNFRGLTSQHIRISIQSVDDQKRLHKAFSDYFNKL